MSSEVQLKAVIFDLDGVLVDTSVFHAQAWANLVRSVGVEPPADLEERVKGISRMASLKIALGDAARSYSEEELTALATQKNDHYLRLVADIGEKDLYPGVKDLFADLKANNIKVVLGSASKNAKPVLEGLGILDQFDDVIDGFRYKHGKPHPDIFLTAAEAVGATPAECIVVEDATAGINSALDGGFVTVGMGSYTSLCHAHMLIDSLAELSAETLSELLSRWNARAWQLVREGVPAAGEDMLFCTGNGQLGLGGEMTGMDRSEPGLFCVSRLGCSCELGRPVCPDLLGATWEIAGETMDFDAGEVTSMTRRLDLRSGTFVAEVHWTSPQGKQMVFGERRWADRSVPGRAFVQYELEPLNFSGEVTVKAEVTSSADAAYRLAEATAPEDFCVAMLVEGDQQNWAAFGVGLSALDRPEAAYSSDASVDQPTVIVQTHAEQDKVLYVRRVVMLGEGNCGGSAIAEACGTLPGAITAYESARIASTAAWGEYWAEFDPAAGRTDLTDDEKLALREQAYHQSIKPHPSENVQEA